MNLRKIAAFAAAAVMAAGICTGVPVGTDNAPITAITAEAYGELKVTAQPYTDGTVDITWTEAKDAYCYHVIASLSATSVVGEVFLSTSAKKDFEIKMLRGWSEDGFELYVNEPVKAVSKPEYTFDLDISDFPNYAWYSDDTPVNIEVIACDKNGDSTTETGSVDIYRTNMKKRSTSSSSNSAGTAAPSASKLSAPAGIKGKVTQNKIVMTWNKVDGAEGYRVYKYDEKTGKYYKYKDVAGTKCTVSGLKVSTKYKFKIYVLVSENGKFVPQSPTGAFSFTTKAAKKAEEPFNDELITL